LTFVRATVSDTDEAPKVKYSRKQTKGFKAQLAPAQTKRSANSDTNNSKPKKEKEAAFHRQQLRSFDMLILHSNCILLSESEPDAPPKPQPSAKRPPPSKPKSPSTAGPSSGANFRPRPRPSYRGTRFGVLVLRFVSRELTPTIRDRQVEQPFQKRKRLDC
jgi:hypothetical protein